MHDERRQPRRERERHDLPIGRFSHHEERGDEDQALRGDGERFGERTPFLVGFPQNPQQLE
jgi:hypothetical protein